MPITTSAMRAVAGIGKGAFRLAASGPAGRAIVGGIAGGVIGAFQGWQNPNIQTESISKGILLGALGGGFISKTPKMAYSAMRTIAKGSPFSATSLGRGGWAAKKMMAFAAKNPRKTALGIGALYGASVYNNATMGTSPTMSGSQVNTEYNKQAIAMDQMTMGGTIGLGMVGTAPQMMNRYHHALQQSTHGLTLGLHRGRHG